MKTQEKIMGRLDDLEKEAEGIPDENLLDYFLFYLKIIRHQDNKVSEKIKRRRSEAAKEIKHLVLRRMKGVEAVSCLEKLTQSAMLLTDKTPDDSPICMNFCSQRADALDMMSKNPTPALC
jgi:hypothetical protein